MKKIAFLLVICSIVLSAQEVGARYLIITHDDFYDAILPYAHWKHKKGMRTKVVTLSEIGSSSTQIRDYIINAYNTWTVRPEFLLLVGAPNFLPLTQSGGAYSDNYYANIKGDLYNDILPGRLTVHSAYEAQTVVNKMMLYERYPDLTDSLWCINACLIVREDNDPPDDSIYWDDVRQARAYMRDYGYHTIDTLSRSAGNTSTDVINAVNEGRSFVLYRGQGVNNWWSPFGCDPNQCANGAKLPFVLSITCSTIGTGSTAAGAEKWFLVGSPTESKGAVGYFATTTIVIGQAYLRSAVSKGFFDALFRDSLHTFGEACEGGRKRVLEQYGSSSEYCGFMTIGDPEMNIWTAIPQPMEVSHDSALFVGDESLSVLVYVENSPSESALVCAVLDTVIYKYGYTDSNGHIAFPMDGLIPGQMDLTVTGENLIPYEAIIPVSDTNAYLLYDHYQLSDSLANGNGIPESGETVLLRVTIKNSGLSAAHNVLVFMTTDDTLAHMIDDTVYYGDIGAQDSSAGNSPFVCAISPFCPGDHAVVFDLLMKDTNNNIWTGGFTMNVHNVGGVTGPDEYGYYAYDDTDTLAGHAPVFEWFEIGPTGPGALVNEITDEDADTVTYALPFTFTYYGLDYSSIGLCSNGFAEIGYSTHRFGTNAGIPAPGPPTRLVAAFWDDLDPSLAGDIYYYYDASTHRWICQFDDCAHYDNSAIRETFQFMLLDPQYYPTPTGDGELLIQYQQVADASSNSVGIEDETDSRGIQYVFNNNYHENAEPLMAGRAILFTTVPPAGTYNTPWLYVEEYSIDDSTAGNNNGLVDPGETIYISIYAKNEGDSTAFDVTGTLRSEDTDCQILDSTALFGDIYVGMSGNNTSEPFIVEIDSFPVDSTIGFKLHFECNAGLYQKDDYFTIYLCGFPHVAEFEDNRIETAGLTLFPNPTKGSARIIVYTPQQMAVQPVITIYDVSGRQITALHTSVNKSSARSYSAVWNGKDNQGRTVANGIYFVSVKIEEKQHTRKLILLR
jgi:hypothetical protein